MKLQVRHQPEQNRDEHSRIVEAIADNRCADAEQTARDPVATTRQAVRQQITDFEPQCVAE